VSAFTEPLLLLKRVAQLTGACFWTDACWGLSEDGGCGGGEVTGSTCRSRWLLSVILLSVSEGACGVCIFPAGLLQAAL